MRGSGIGLEDLGLKKNHSEHKAIKSISRNDLMVCVRPSLHRNAISGAYQSSKIFVTRT